MKEILGNNLEQFFNNNFLNNDTTRRLTYKGNRCEVWEVSNTVFDVMCDMTEEEFICSAGEDAWWRSADGCNLGSPDTTVHINGCKLIGWAGEPWEDEEEDDEFEIYSNSLSDYLADVIGASQPRNVCAIAVDLAKYNNMTMAELFAKCEK